MRSLPFLLLLLAFFVSCNESLNFDPKYQGPYIAVSSHKRNYLFNDKSVETVTISGKCKDGFRYLMTYPTRAEITCSGGRWNQVLDLAIVPEGTFSVKFESLDGVFDNQSSFIKRYTPVHLDSAALVRDVSVVQELYHSKNNEAAGYLSYTSDEYCSKAECYASNIAVRLRSENYATAYHVTSDKLISSTSSKGHTLADGNLRFFYLSSDTETGGKNIYYSDFDLTTKTSKPRVKITNETTDSASYFHVLAGPGNIFHLFYLSKEYCRANACAVNKVSWRNSSDAYSSVSFLGTHVACGISELRGASNGTDIHLAYGRTNAGACVGGANRDFEKYSAGAWTRVTASVPWFGASKLFVSPAGEAFLFYRTLNGWEAGCVPGNWFLGMRRSSTNFAAITAPASGCPFQIGYPGDPAQAAVSFDSSGVLHLATTVTSPTYGITLSSLSDNFATRTTHHSSVFSQLHNHKEMISTDLGQEIFYVESGALNRLVVGATTTKYELIDVLNDNLLPVLYQGNIAFIGTSKEWCRSNGCNNLNYFIKPASSNVKTWLTTISQSDLVLASPKFIPNGSDYRFLYSSNESNAQALNVSYRDSTDNYATRTIVTNTGVGTVNEVHDWTIDGLGNTHWLLNENYRVIKRSSDTAYVSSGPLDGSQLAGSLSTIVGRHDGETGIFYGGNESGAWAANVRWSIDNFATRKYAISGINYYNRTMVWNNSDDLDLYYIADEDADLRYQISKRSSVNNYATVSYPFFLTTQSVCNIWTQPGWINPIAANYDGTGRLFIMYAAKTDGSNACKLYVRSSDDWTKVWSLTSDYPNHSFEPLKIFFKSGTLPTVCARTSFSVSCFDLNKATRQ